MKFTQDTKPYNEKRYGKPWIAKVTFNNKQGDFHFGDWIGEEGSYGVLELECKIGDVIAIGQKDHRKPSNSAAVFHILNSNGDLTKVTKVTAYKHWLENYKEQQNPLVQFTDEELLAEIKRRGLKVS